MSVKPLHAAPPRSVVVTIGIDRYRAWPHLRNAVNDARGAMHAFVRHGFEQLAEPLCDEAATADAIRGLVLNDLATLTEEDRLILFFAGHGHTTTHSVGDHLVKTGYMIPVDADMHSTGQSGWLKLDAWLSDVARLRVRHVLVFIDACNSGIALGATTRWRGLVSDHDAFQALARRRSRRVITSALDDQLAIDNGPSPLHSLFTGCLIECLEGGIAGPGELITGSQIGHYLQRRVSSYPGSLQTPDFGSFEGDMRGELIIQLASSTKSSAQPLTSAVSSRSFSTTWTDPGSRKPATVSEAGSLPTEAAKPARDLHRDPLMENRADVAVLIALDEEFDQFAKLVKLERAIDDGHGGFYFPFELPGPKGAYWGVAKLIGEMGISAARGPAEWMLVRWKPAVAAMVGIAASLDTDVKLGDVVVATQVDAYDANLKAVRGRRAGVEYLHRGTAFRGDPRLLAAIRDLRFAQPARFESFVSTCTTDCELILSSESRYALAQSGMLSPGPSVHRVHVASGSVVGATVGFKKWLRRRDQTLKALEMEGAALAEAAESCQPQIPALVLRGISDFGDERKQKLDGASGGAVRRYAMRNATRYLRMLGELGVLPRLDRSVLS
jgi:nucleoside phosphorylase